MANLLTYLDKHPALVGVVVYVFGSALINWIARLESPEAWDELKLKQPRLAAVYSVFRAIGVDPVKLARAVVAIASARWPGPPPSVAPPNRDKP